jgi:hypothetical protein
LPDEWIRDDIWFWFKGEEGRNGGLLLKTGTMNFLEQTAVSSFLIPSPKNGVIPSASEGSLD